jgi:hypothetical protein
MLRNICKFVLSFVIVITLSSCVHSLKLLKATSQKWCITEKKLKGTAYHIVCETKFSYRRLKLDSIFIQQKWFREFNYSVLGKKNTFQEFNKNDSVLISLTVMDTLPSLPIYLSYSLDNKKKQLTINHIKILPSLCPDK